jgi:hypothetical protein
MSPKLTLLVLAAVVTTTIGCAIPVRNGGRLYIMGGPPLVVVTNNTKIPCELTGNGAHLTDLQTGSTYNVELSFVLEHNTILACKAYTVQRDGQRVYIGQISRDFRRYSRSSEHQEWIINSIQMAR